METPFNTAYPTILDKIDHIDPLKYGQTRNYINGDVSYLSPYISRGVISTKQILIKLLAKGYKISQIESFVKELCWRDYFQRVGQVKNLNQDIKQPHLPVLNFEIPSAIVTAQTGIIGIDNAIEQLYHNGYMHNHCRMYTASVVCNIAKSYWLLPAQWMYPAYVFPFTGDWTGTYAGDDQGTVAIAIDSAGNLAGSAYSNNAMSTFNLSGSVDTSGKLNATSATTGATFAGTLTPTTGSGTWTNTTIGGTWSATKK